MNELPTNPTRIDEGARRGGPMSRRWRRALTINETARSEARRASALCVECFIFAVSDALPTIRADAEMLESVPALSYCTRATARAELGAILLGYLVSYGR